MPTEGEVFGLPLLLFDLSLFQTIVEFLDVQTAMRLRSTCRQAVAACSSPALSPWKHQFVLPAMMQVCCSPPGHDWFKAPLMTDTHACWLFENSADVEEVDLRNAPFPTDLLLQKIASECPNLKSFSVRRGQDFLRISFHEALQGLTEAGVVALIENCSRLEFLCLSWCESVHGDVVCEAIRQSPTVCLTLQHLNLDGVPGTNDAAMVSLASCTNLRFLKMKDTSATDISPLVNCTQLETLHLCRGWGIVPAGVVTACEGFRDSIRVLCCAGCSQLNEESARQILEMCSKLETFNCLRGTAIGLEHGIRVRRHLATSRQIRLDDTFIC
jgi:hypothetical protein